MSDTQMEKNTGEDGNNFDHFTSTTALNESTQSERARELKWKSAQKISSCAGCLQFDETRALKGFLKHTHI
jgi:hypothetical protein